MLQIPDLTRPDYFVISFLVFFLLIVGRYFLIAGLFYGIFFIWQPEKWAKRKIGKQAYKQGQLRKEIGWSTVSAMIFALAGTFTMLAWQKGWTSIYTDPALYGWWYIPVSVLLSMLIHETYYYWTHRLMHHPSIFRVVHKVHHDSHTTSPFTAFSFHPTEALIQAVILPVTLMILPLHPVAILVQLVLMSFSSVINHLNIEIYPDKFQQHRVGKWIIGATHHSMHHKQHRFNFGLYFTFWDRLRKTEARRG